MGCSHSNRRALNDEDFAHDKELVSAFVVDDHEDITPLEDQLEERFLLGSCNANWLQKNPDGRCTHTNCFVGTSGDPNDCFECKQSCDNGCGAKDSVLNTKGNFLLFDFGNACCNHDHCWSSNSFSKRQCDQSFLKEMTDECPTLPFLVSLVLNFSGPVKTVLGACDILAYLFATGVWLDPLGAHASAQTTQKAYESTDVCIAKCPTTQTSGGQGTTVLTIDMLRSSGTFTVDYQMYGIPDQLFIEYEGTRIFDTGGLVSGGAASRVTYSGSSTRIKVTINAPNVGTAWDIFVGCPDTP